MEKSLSIQFLQECLDELDNITDADIARMASIYSAQKENESEMVFDLIIPTNDESCIELQWSPVQIDITTENEDFYDLTTEIKSNMDSCIKYAA